MNRYIQDKSTKQLSLRGTIVAAENVAFEDLKIVWGYMYLKIDWNDLGVFFDGLFHLMAREVISFDLLQ